MTAVLLALNMAAVTLTGVVSQKGADFLLVEPQNMKPIAHLEGVGFTTEHFANFIGQNVRVKGTLVNAKDGGKTLRVRSVADIERIEPASPPPPPPADSGKKGARLRLPMNIYRG